MSKARLAVSGNGSQPTFWLVLVAFGRNAEHLRRYRKGDVVSVTGSLELNAWTTSDGEQRHDLQVIVEQLLGARPKPRAKPPAPPVQPQLASLPFDDPLPF